MFSYVLSWFRRLVVYSQAYGPPQILDFTTVLWVLERTIDVFASITILLLLFLLEATVELRLAWNLLLYAPPPILGLWT